MYIYGCGGLGLELASCLADVSDHNANSIAFIDTGNPRREDAEKLLGRSVEFLPAIGHADAGSDVFIGVGEPRIRSKIFEQCLRADLQPQSFIHSTAHINTTAVIGPGSIILPFAYVGPFAQIGVNCVLNIYSSVGHHAQVLESSVLSPYATLNGFSHCGQASLVGSHAAIMPSCRLGDYSKISAGSILNQTSDNCVLAHGNPAKTRVLFKPPSTVES